MSRLQYLLTRGPLDPAAGRAGGVGHRVRLVVCELETRDVPAGDMGIPAESSLRSLLGSSATPAESGAATGQVSPQTSAQADEPLPIRIPPPGAVGLPPNLLSLPLVAAAPQAGAPPVVWFGDPLAGYEQYRFSAYDLSYRGGVRLAVGDVTGDGIPDLVTGAGVGGGPHVKVFDGATGSLAAGPLGSFMAFEESFRGGVTVAVGDRNGDGYGDIAIGAGVGGGPRVRTLSGKDGSVIRDFYVFEEELRCGVSVAFADANGDGLFGLVVGTGVGVSPRVKVYNSADGSVLEEYPVFEPSHTAGVFVAGGDVNGDGFVDIIAAARLAGPRVTVLNGRSGEVIQDFYSGDRDFRGGVTVGTIDLTDDGVPEIITGTGPGGGSLARVHDALTGELLHEHRVFGFGGILNTGLNVAGH